MKNIDPTTGQPVISSTNIQWVGEISEDTEYHQIVTWENNTVTVESSEGDIITLTPELKSALKPYVS